MIGKLIICLLICNVLMTIIVMSEIRNEPKCQKKGGECKDIKTSSCSSGAFYDNYCPAQDWNIKCWVPAYQEDKCRARGGTCMNEHACVGTIVKGLCPSQPNAIRCCFTTPSGVYEEKPCTDRGGHCLHESNCKGRADPAPLCPTQPYAIKCCFTTPSGVYEEKPCTDRGGHCLHESNCKGRADPAPLCPTQPAAIKCCFTSPSNNGNPSPNGCGCVYNYATGPSNGPAQGAKRLAAYFKGRFGGTTQIYNPKKIPGSNTWSLHAEGRAVDLFLTGKRGREAFDHAVGIACTTGIQEVIFSRRIWSARKGERHYSGVHPHYDHVHIGLNRCGAQKFNF